MYEWKLIIKGGPGSGNWGHAGRPGQVGGSASSGMSSSLASKLGAYADDRTNSPVDHYYEELVAAYSGQTNMNLIAYDKDSNPVGLLEYSEYESVPHISMVTTHHQMRGKGIGKKLVAKLQSEYPDEEVQWGYTTDEGTLLRDSYKRLVDKLSKESAR